VRIFRWQTILAFRHSLRRRHTILSQWLAIWQNTKRGHSCDIEIWWPRCWKCRTRAVTFSTSGSSYFNVYSLPCIICKLLTYNFKPVVGHMTKHVIVVTWHKSSYFRCIRFFWRKAMQRRSDDIMLLHRYFMYLHSFFTRIVFIYRYFITCLTSCN